MTTISPGGLPSDTFGYTRAETATGDTYLIAFDRLNRINREKMTNGGTTKFQFDHTYDGAGNRTALTIAGTLHPARSFGYTYNGMGHLTQITENVNLNNYTATPTTDANGNITQIDEKWNGANTLTNTFVYDRAEVPRHECRGYSEHDIAAVGVTVEHAYDGLGRLVKTMRTKSGATTDYEHVRDGSRADILVRRHAGHECPAYIGNIDATNSNTAPSDP